MNEFRRFCLLGIFLDVEPSTNKIMCVLSQIFFGNSDSGGSDDKSARRQIYFILNFLNQSSESASFLCRFDLTRNPKMFDRRHINDKSARKCDMRSNACTFFGDRFFGDLNENFLTFLKQIGNCRLRTLAAASAFVISLIAAVAF